MRRVPLRSRTRSLRVIAGLLKTSDGSCERERYAGLGLRGWEGMLDGGDASRGGSGGTSFGMGRVNSVGVFARTVRRGTLGGVYVE